METDPIFYPQINKTTPSGRSKSSSTTVTSPQLKFEYSRAVVQEDVRTLYVASMEICRMAWLRWREPNAPE
jgi:hypothetical protein